jgi:hypothetical protein
VNGVLQIQVCYKNAARVWPKGVWFHVFDSNLRHIQYSTRLAFPCLWHYAPRSEGGCLRPTSKGGLRLTDSVNPLGSYWFLQRQEIKVNTQDSRPHLHQAIYLHFRSFERGGVSDRTTHDARTQHWVPRRWGALSAECPLFREHWVLSAFEC